MTRIILAIVTSIMLTACVTDPVISPVSEGYTGTTAILWDSVENSTEKRGDFFFADKVNGVDIEDSEDTTHHYNHGMGLSMYPVVASRVVPSGKLTVEIEGTIIHAAPILSILGDDIRISGVVTVDAEISGMYVVRGKLSEHHSEIWIEDMNTGERVSEVVSQSLPKK